MNIVTVAIAGVIVGILITLVAWHTVSTEQRIKRLENNQQPQQTRLTHYQQEKLEELSFTFGHLMAMREQENEFFLNIYNRLGKLLDDGPNGDNEKSYSKKSRKHLRL